MARTTITAEVKKIITWDSAFVLGAKDRRAIFKDEKNTYVWTTTKWGATWMEEEKRNIVAGDVVTFTATIGETTTYNGNEQIKLTRCKDFSFVEHKETYEERMERTKAERIEKQKKSIKESDRVLHMEYSRYKNHYADCETIIGSYRGGDEYRFATIWVIVPEGRMKPNGMRGQNVWSWPFVDEDGHGMTISAIDLEHAKKRLPKGKEWKYIGPSWLQ